MRQYAPFILVILAIVIAVFTIIGDSGYSKLKQLQSSVQVQKEKNDVLSAKVKELRGQVVGIQKDDRILEKNARNELGMAKPNELIFLFDLDKNKNQQK